MKQQSRVSDQVYGGLALIMRLVVFAAIALGVLLLVRIIYLFFGALKTAPGYEWVVSFTEPFTKPLAAIEPIKTPYDGIFDIAATGALLGVMLIEFILSGIKNYFQKKAEHLVVTVAPLGDQPLDKEALKQEEPIGKR